jgi:electron transfer flavoprotein alpha/beta subunit
VPGKTGSGKHPARRHGHGADRSILIETDQSHDSIFTARALAAAIRSDGQPWLILTGKESIDSEGMQTQFRMAEGLGMPVATNVVKVDGDGEGVQVECEREPGTIDVIRMHTPCVLAAGKGLNTPNYPTFPDIVKSRKKPVKRIGLSDLAIDQPPAGMHVEVLVPAVEQRMPKAIVGQFSRHRRADCRHPEKRSQGDLAMIPIGLLIEFKDGQDQRDQFRPGHGRPWRKPATRRIRGGRPGPRCPKRRWRTLV